METEIRFFFFVAIIAVTISFILFVYSNLKLPETHLYHFCAMRQSAATIIDYQEGTIELSRKDLSSDEFNKLRIKIGEGFTPPEENGDRVIILSLTRL